MRVVIIALLIHFFACAHSKPREACDYTAEEFASYLGESEPKVLDLDGSGSITTRDYGIWLEECSP